jgi:tetratricopeptide (TPR) repeat protein
VYHKREQYDDALKNYFQTVDLNKYNYAAHYCLAQIHYLNGNINAVDEALTRVLSNPRYKDCYEALVLLAKVKTMQGQRYEAMALYKRLIEKIYPKSLINLHPSSFQVA